jgi:RNA polymerase sigma-70 factor (ECF subfamily)
MIKMLASSNIPGVNADFPLSGRFFAGAARLERGDAALEALLASAHTAGIVAWPGVTLGAGDFAAHLGLMTSGTPAAVGTLAVADLYLACACARGDARAVAALERAHDAAIDGALSRLRLAAVEREEARQALRVRILLPRDGAPPRIAEYSGRGELRGWLCVAASRIALNARRGVKREVQLGDDLLAALPSPALDPELEALRGRTRAEFRAAFAEAVAALSPRARNVLRQHHVDGLGIGELGGVYRVHRVTASRWVVEAQAALIDGLRAAFSRRAGITRDELPSLLRILQSQLELSLGRVLDRSD